MAVRLSTHSAASGRAFISRVQLQPCRPIGVAFSTAHSITQKQFIGQETLQQRLSAGSTVCRATMGTAQQAAALVNRQLELYNSRDVDAFMSIVADDVLVMDGVTGAVLAQGKEQLRPRYVERFKTPVHCELLGRLVLGNVVVDREIITGLPDGGEADCMATYVCDLEAGKITKMTFVWQPRTPGVKL